eukprot:2888033-Pleurochrysis_carterae.AAC.2
MRAHGVRRQRGAGNALRSGDEQGTCLCDRTSSAAQEPQQHPVTLPETRTTWRRADTHGPASFPEMHIPNF